MKLLKKHKGTIKQGKLLLKQRDIFAKNLIKFEGKEIYIVIDKWSEKQLRSEAANRYYWGVVLATIEAETGQDKDLLHAFFGKMFLMRHEEVLGKIIDFIPSTTSLSPIEFMEYINKIKDYAAQPKPEGLGIYIPEAGEIVDNY